MAIAALVLGILTFFCLGPLGGILAIVFGFLGLSKAKQVGTGRGMSIAGIVLGTVGTVATVGILLAIVLGGSSTTVRSNSGPAVTTTVPGGATSTTVPGQAPATTGPSGDATPKDPTSIYMSEPIAIPAGEPGKLSIVLTGPPSGTVGSTVPVVVRNNTDQALRDIEVTGTARGSDGSLADTGSSQGLKPSTVQPGEWAMGYVYFSSPVPDGATLDLSATGTKASQREIISNIDLPVAEVKLNPGPAGSSEVVGIASNTSTKDIGTGATVILMCFADGKPVSTDIGSTEGSSGIAAGGTAPFSVSLFKQDCPVFAVGVSGYE